MMIDKIGQGINLNSQSKVSSSAAPSFGDYLKSALDSANEAQVNSDAETTKVITGESPDIHNALIAAEEARIQMELVVQVRNKLLDSYQEIERMQV
jgi:flagellar hook-basal body complex protein FliE